MLIALPDIDSFENKSSLPVLPHVVPIFFVPPLEDVPQNPIIDNLKIEEANLNLPTRTVRQIRVEAQVQHLTDARQSDLHGLIEETEHKTVEVETLWAEAACQKIRVSL